MSTGGKTFAKYTLPSLPRAAMQILQLVQDPDVEVPDLAKAIELDPALAGRIVRLSNSSLYGLSREVSSVRQAVVMLGLRNVKMAALSFTLVNASPKDPNNQSLSKCWRRILTNALGCRLAAPLFSLNPEEAFLAGLMQDIAMLVFCTSLADRYWSLVEQSLVSKQTIEQIEQENFGATHAELGARWLEEWKFPVHMVEAVAVHHQVEVEKSLAENRQDMPALMAFVEWVTGFLLYPSIQNYSNFLTVCHKFGTGGQEIDRFVQRLDQQVAETASMLDMKLPMGKNYDTLLTEARSLAKLLEENPELAEPSEDENGGISIGGRDSLDRRVEEVLTESHKKHEKPAVILLCRLVHINKLDQEGRPQVAGDYLREAAAGIQQSLESNQTVFSFSRDTYCVVAPDLEMDGTQSLLKKINSAVAGKSVTLGGQPSKTGAVYGIVSVAPTLPPGLESLYRQLEKNLIEAPQKKGICFTRM